MTWWAGIAALEERHWRRQRELFLRELEDSEMWPTPPLLVVVVDDPGGRRIHVGGWTGWQKILPSTGAV